MMTAPKLGARRPVQWEGSQDDCCAPTLGARRPAQWEESEDDGRAPTLGLWRPVQWKVSQDDGRAPTLRARRPTQITLRRPVVVLRLLRLESFGFTLKLQQVKRISFKASDPSVAAHNAFKQNYTMRFSDEMSHLPMTAYHILQDCTLYSGLRRNIWPTDTSIKTKLYQDLEELKRTIAKLYQDLEELKRTIAFISGTGLVL